MFDQMHGKTPGTPASENEAGGRTAPRPLRAKDDSEGFEEDEFMDDEDEDEEFEDEEDDDLFDDDEEDDEDFFDDDDEDEDDLDDEDD